jgi:hypothetical protein
MPFPFVIHDSPRRNATGPSLSRNHRNVDALC